MQEINVWEKLITYRIFYEMKMNKRKSIDFQCIFYQNGKLKIM